MKLAMICPSPLISNGKQYAVASHSLLWFIPVQYYFDRLDLIIFLKKMCNLKGLEVLNIDASRVRIFGIPFPRNAWEEHIFKAPLIMWALIRLFQKHWRDWDAIFIWYSPNVACLWSYILARALDIPVVLFCGVDPGTALMIESRYKSIFKRILCKALALYSKKIFSLMVTHIPTIVTGEDLFNRYKNKNPNLYKIFSTRVHIGEIEKELIQQRRHLRHNFNILTVTRIVPVKTLEYLIDAVAEIRNLKVNALLKIVGPLEDIDYFFFLQNKIKKLNLERVIQFVGAVSYKDLIKFYREADVFVLPSVSEGTPKVIPEAMAKALPIVATRVGGIPEMVTNGREGILVNPKDTAGLARALQRLAQDKELKRKMSQASIKKSYQFTVEVQIQKLANIIKTIHQGGKN